MKLRIKYIPLLILNLISINILGQTVDHWETILQPGNTCTYQVPNAPLPANWTDIGFNDASWTSGTGGVGYGDNDDNSLIPDPSISAYSKYKFTVSSPDAIGALILDMDYDDGFVAYLNGVEIARYNMGSPGSATTWDQLSSALHEADIYQGGIPSRFNLYDTYLENLVVGENLFAVEVHNYSENSSDLTSNPYLLAGIKTTQSYYAPAPEWFIKPFESTLLPLMVIDTKGEVILNDPRITAHMGLIHNSSGNYNKLSDPFNEYDGQISIEIRGESTQGYAKKSYSIETQTDSGTNNNISLLGLPIENDWVLNGPYGDKSLLRNVISYRVYENFEYGYSPRTKFFELILNGEYMGIYILLEKIKVDKNRVDIAKITPLDVTPEDISGGYILRIDKTTDMAPPEYWDSPIHPPYNDFSNIRYQYFDPKYEELTSQQSLYIREWMADFDQMLSSFNFDDIGSGYRQYIDVLSFIDFEILNEFNKDVDAYRLSNYFYKQKDTNGGKLVAGPPWDYNLTFGNMDYGGDIKETYNWMYPKTINPYWWKRLMEDSWYRNELYCRWDNLFAGPLSHANVHMMIDTSLQLLGDAIDRNFQRWQILGEYVWPNDFIGQTHGEEVTFLKNWISSRLTWINSQWGDRCVPTSDNLSVIEQEPEIYVYPNPGNFASAKISINLRNTEQALNIVIMDAAGRVVDQIVVNNPQTGRFQIPLPDYSYLSAGLYVIQVRGGNGLFVNMKYLKR